MSNIEDIVNSLSNISVMELIDLTRKMETVWGVKAVPNVVQKAEEPKNIVPVVEQSEFTVILQSVPADKKMAVIKLVREITQLGLKESKELVESVPKTLKESISKAEAEDLKQKLTDVGAVVELK